MKLGTPMKKTYENQGRQMKINDNQWRQGREAGQAQRSRRMGQQGREERAF